MAEDALFEDGSEQPLRLRAEDAQDLSVVAALVQDAVLPAGEMKWERRKHRFVCLINRFRWEDKLASNRNDRAPERVQTLLSIDDVARIQQQGLDQMEPANTVLSILTLAFEPSDDGTGRIIFTLSGDGAIAADVESINVTLQDVTRPYRAPSQQTPAHPE